MTSPAGRGHDDRDVDAEFARMLEGEGLVLGPGEAPREPAAPEPHEDEDPWPGEEEPSGPPSPESIARSRAAHPSAARPSNLRPGGADRQRGRGADSPRELDDEDVLYGDFAPPDPDLPIPSDRALWSWAALLGGFALLLVGALTPTLPGFLGWLGGLAAVGGLIALLLRAPRDDEEDNDPHSGAAL